jgi:hypothetical protein
MSFELYALQAQRLGSAGQRVLNNFGSDNLFVRAGLWIFRKKIWAIIVHVPIGRLM